MVVDSFRFLPRSFRPMYEGRGPLAGEGDEVWAPFAKRLADSRVALLTSAGLYVKVAQAPFDLDAERLRPEWGDPSWRAIPAATERAAIGVAHLHISDADVLADPQIALPAGELERFAAEGVIGSAAADHISVMGYQDRGLEEWRERTAPEIAEHLRREDVDGLILAPA